MSAYRLLGNIEPLGPAKFFVIASAIPTDPAGKTEVLKAVDTTNQEAEVMPSYMIEQLGEAVTTRGDTVVDVLGS